MKKYPVHYKGKEYEVRWEVSRWGHHVINTTLCIYEDKIRHGQFGDFLESFISKNLGKVADAYAEWQEDRMERCQAHEFKAIGNADGFIERYVYEHFDERGDI